ncbi:MarR family winged helix-turn-helix transcriptional regulator [Oryzobacter terrae]|uniref:MarR family winged helix-turn-helix transcriptional regulator n=1 Tax=Oryzobacter terrae TaxID=1620385 RepID=UPI003672AA66
MSGPTDALDLDRQICFPLYAATRAMTRRYTELLAPVGLTYPQYLVMLALWSDGDLTVGALGRRLSLDSGTLTPLLKRLEAAGLVDRRRDPEDERRVVVSPTRAGHDLRAAVAHVPAGIAASLVMERADAVALRRILAELVSTLDPQGEPVVR